MLGQLVAEANFPAAIFSPPKLRLDKLEHESIILIAHFVDVEVPLVIGTAQHVSFRDELKTGVSDFFNHQTLIDAVQGFLVRVTAPFARRVIDNAVDAAFPERRQDSLIHSRPSRLRQVVIVEMGQCKI
jgi:hypothetical protein